MKKQNPPYDLIVLGAGSAGLGVSISMNKAGFKVLLVDKSEQDIGGECLNYLQTTNKDVFISGDAAGSLKFSHGAELHTRLLVNNFFSPIKKKLSYRHFSWVTFTEPEVAHFGLDEQQLKEQGLRYERWETDFALDDRAVIGDYRDSRMILFIERNRFPGRKDKLTSLVKKGLNLAFRIKG